MQDQNQNIYSARKIQMLAGIETLARLLARQDLEISASDRAELALLISSCADSLLEPGYGVACSSSRKTLRKVASSTGAGARDKATRNASLIKD